jgi:hypothetical protein
MSRTSPEFVPGYHNRGKPESEQIPHWHPHQLRHTDALELKREAGLDVARAVLGHRRPVITAAGGVGRAGAGASR